MITRSLHRYVRTFPPRQPAVRLNRLSRRPQLLLSVSRARPTCRSFASKTSTDEKIEEIQELYATAKDEFEIAFEETEKKTVYAADDRAAAQEELRKLKEFYEEALKNVDGEQIKGRVGPRIRELERAVEAMEEKAMED